MKILFFHKSNSSYLPFTLSQVAESNSNSDVVLIGDISNNCYDFITHAQVSDYSDSANEFEKIYEHKSLAPYQFELICFLRWFVFKDYVYKNDIDGDFVCLDSDVLVYQNIERIKPILDGYDLTIRGQGGAGFQWFRSKEVLNDFCDFIVKQYTEPNLINRLDLCWFEHQKRNYGGICDMYMFNFYIEEGTYKVKDISIPEGDLIIEKAILDVKDCLHRNGILNVRFKRGNASFSTQVGKRFWIFALHNQDKQNMHKYYIGTRYRTLMIKQKIFKFVDIITSRLKIRTRIKGLFNGTI